jgi:hypothetical protein
VIDSQGRAVGLNAGGKNKAQSAYYLPLERVVRALQVLQQQWPLAAGPAGALSSSWCARCVRRGDLQTTFLFKVRVAHACGCRGAGGVRALGRWWQARGLASGWRAGRHHAKARGANAMHTHTCTPRTVRAGL